jgi:CRISPR-associated protein Csm2
MELGQRAAGEELGRTQIRNIYDTIKALHSKRQRDYRKLILMLPKLQYAAARKSELKPLVDALCDGIQLVEGQDDRFENFVDFFEAVVAYHYVASRGN